MQSINTQKVHGCGVNKERRYFWNVTVVGEGSGQYRSRHATTAGVRSEFKKNGKKVLSVVAAKA